MDATDGFIINGIKNDTLSVYLKKYNDEEWITNWLSQDRKVYFSEEIYPNNILLHIFKGFIERDKNTRIVDIDAYLKDNRDEMRVVDMYGSKFFVKLHEI